MVEGIRSQRHSFYLRAKHNGLGSRQCQIFKGPLLTYIFMSLFWQLGMDTMYSDHVHVRCQCPLLSAFDSCWLPSCLLVPCFCVFRSCAGSRSWYMLMITWCYVQKTEGYSTPPHPVALSDPLLHCSLFKETQKRSTWKEDLAPSIPTVVLGYKPLCLDGEELSRFLLSFFTH